ncbi:uncharacterized protein LTR77_001862 [Saxophila tyrrhenica]|uniref:RING-type domain-containing protein n=1 Tax=Saxophila tyrrhenica TaxID=1690608 RepID=A0AAV9PMQ5_9PEZI|nr:hypothetical protein LTR77_001862 [Saxophila tyrrhenica]
MAEASLERELQCAICTDILYQPLTLLDCLHTFCGSCLKEWFTWQATSASSNRRAAAPYTCPSCRESVRGTKVDWRANTLLEGFLKANPDRGKTESEKEEMRKIYTPGDDVLKPIPQHPQDEDSEDERLMAQVRELSLAGSGAGAGAGRQRAERSRDRRREREGGGGQRREHSHLTEARLRQHDQHVPQVEHQPSLRSLLSASETGAQDVQAEILRSIYAEGVLDGIDLDNLTTEQEEELTDRIAAAYRRRQEQRQQEQQQPRDRSRNREHRHRENRSPQVRPAVVSNQSPPQAQTGTDTTGQTRARPPISRPHLFEQGLQEPPRAQRRSASSTSQQTNRSAPRHDGSTSANRSATDLSQQPSSGDTQRTRHHRLSSTGRSITDPQAGGMREDIQRIRAASNQDRPSSSSRTIESSHAQQPSHAPNQARTEASSRNVSSSSATETNQSVRPAMSMAAFAPEPVASSFASQAAPSIACDRCGTQDIELNLHYNCSQCLNGNFNICRRCYRDEQGCNYWFGFGFRANDRWYRNAPPDGWPHGQEFPHVLSPRRYVRVSPPQPSRDDAQSTICLQEGAICESCFAFSNDCYWYCTEYCLEGAWGFCDNCVKQGRHCTHALLLTSYIGFLQQPHYDPTKYSIVDLPHLPQGSYATLPPTTHCDICHRPIPPNSTRFHCYQCSEGDYDMCNECYRSLVAQGKISQSNGPDGWRRCLKGHRMAIVGYQDRSEGGHLRHTVSEMVGGWDFKEDESTRAGHPPPSGRLPPAGGQGMRCLALYSCFPAEGVEDELAFPKNAELREVKDVQNDDWFLGVYAGKVNLVPRNHVRMI